MKYFQFALFFVISCICAHQLQADAKNVPPSQQTSPTVNSQDKILFTPPNGWRFAESKDLPKSVKVMVVGQGNNEYPPSINLGTENYSGSLKDYLKRVKEINDSQGHEWKDLGTINVKAGEASLSQVDSKNKWGNVRMMHVILKKDNTIYIMTAASLKDEFPKFYKDFFAAFRSLRFDENPGTQ